MRRRDLLRRTTAALAVGAAAGCLSQPDEAGGEDGSDGETATEANDGETTAGETETTTEETETTTEESETTAEDTETTGGDDAGIRSTSMAGSEAECRSADDEESAAVTFDDGRVDVSGAVALPDPCHASSLAAAEYGDGELLIAVGAGQDDAGTCVQCTAIADYEATVTVDDGGPATVRVEHRTMGETRTISTASR